MTPTQRIVLEVFPGEIKSQMEAIAAKDVQFEEARKALFKKRNLYLRAEEKGLDATLKAALFRKTEKEHVKLLAMIDEKIEMESKLCSIVEKHLGKLEGELTSKLGMNLENPYKNLFADIPEAEIKESSSYAGQTCTMIKSRSSPKKRQTLNGDEPIDPNEPVYCYCKQVSYGDMVACDNPDCALEWFHLPCVDLSSPPKGRWYCRDCRAQQESSSADER